MLKDLRFGVYRFLMRAKEPVLLPEFKGGVLRGAFGTVFREMACCRSSEVFGSTVAERYEAQAGQNQAQCDEEAPEDEVVVEADADLPSGEAGKTPREQGDGRRKERPCLTCPTAQGCVYKAVFEPSPPPGSDRLRTLEDIPRPFVLRIPPDPRRILNPGELLIWEIVLIGNAISVLPYFIVAFKEIGERGFGLWRNGQRAKAHLEAVHSVNPFTHAATRIYSGNTNNVDLSRHMEMTGEDILAEARKLSGNLIMVEFRTPTRLKFQGRYVQIPEFHVMVRNLLRRLSTLSYFYQGKELDLDFEGMIERAQDVRIKAHDISWKPWLRYSGRTKMKMDFGGFVGKIWYEGRLAEFRPLLVYGTLTNVGKTATFGLGQYSLGMMRTQAS